MIKEILVAGIKLNNYGAMENLSRIVKNLDANVFTTVEDVYLKTILLAKEDESVKEALECLDITVIAETGVLDAVGQTTILRRKEIEHRVFFLQFMKILERNGYTVCILGADEKEINVAKEYLANEFPRLKIIDSMILLETEDRVVNDINMLAPDVILSVLPSPLQERFLKDYKPMLLAKVWYGIGAERIAGTRLTFMSKIIKFFREHMLKKYVQENVEEEHIESKGE